MDIEVTTPLNKTKAQKTEIINNKRYFCFPRSLDETDFGERQLYLFVQRDRSTNPLAKNIPEFVANVKEISSKYIRHKKTPEEKAETRRLYRKEYLTRPDVRERMAKKQIDEATQAKRKEYALQETVKEKKRQNSKIQRVLRQQFKSKDPEHYKMFLEEAKSIVIKDIDDQQ